MVEYYDPNRTYAENEEVYIETVFATELPLMTWVHLSCNHGPNHDWCKFRRKTDAELATVSQPPQPFLSFSDFLQQQNQILNQINMKTKTTKKDPLKTPFHEAFGFSKSSVTDAEIGLEIEAEGKNLFNSPISYWNVHEDHSLRGVDGHPPLEYVLKKPLSRKEITKALNYLSERLKKAGSEVKMSHRCSVHVHVNCQHYTLKQIYQIILLYMIFEELLVNFSGPDRVGNFFCLRAKDSEYWVKCLVKSIKEMNFNDLFSDNLRYTSCNTASLLKFGSLEFRSMRGTVDQKLIETWIDLLCHIRDVALEFNSPKHIAETFTHVGPDQFFEDVFKDKPDLKKAIKGPEIRKSLWEGFRLMRDIAYAIDWDSKREISEKRKKFEFFEEMEN